MSSLILAPHIDDELIGCYSIVINEHPDVFFLFEKTEERMKEALDFESREGLITILHAIPDLSTYDNIYIPSLQDKHAEHKIVNRLFRNSATKFYSVDMVWATPLSLEDRERKRELLERYYPSQKALWRNDNKYFIFESINDRDYVELVEIHNDEFYATVPAAYKKIATAILNISTDPHKAFNRLLSSTCGPVTLKTKSGLILKYNDNCSTD